MTSRARFERAARLRRVAHPGLRQGQGRQGKAREVGPKGHVLFDQLEGLADRFACWSLPVASDFNWARAISASTSARASSIAATNCSSEV